MHETDSPDVPPRPEPSAGRRRVFAAVTVLLPLVLLALLEGGLRLAGFGDSYPLFVPVPRAEGYLQANPRVVRRFMVDEADAPDLRIRPIPFRRDKAPGTFRIFVQGGSSAAGYPYGFGASPAGMLLQRLHRAFPERPVEVVTTAMAAVNSYTLLDFVPEILAQEPDAVVLYAGHNEYIGVLGVGSGLTAGRRRPVVRTFLRLKRVRLAQLVQRGLAALTPQRPPPGERRTLMATIVAEESIPYGSPLYRRGLAQYRANLGALLRRYREADVPVYVGTLVSNEGDQPPFIGDHAPGADAAGWRRRYEVGRRALAGGDPAAALEELDAAVALDDLHADAHYHRGRALERLGRHRSARHAYLAAKDRDELRFRAPEAMNAILRELAAAEGARVVEVRGALAGASRHGIVGDGLMLEHLHPNLSGYLLLADAFYRALRADGAVGAPERPVPLAVARREMPVTAVDRLQGEWRIGRLTSDWPFEVSPQGFEVPRPRNPVERIARSLFRGTYRWPDAMRRLLDFYRSRHETADAARVAALLADAFPYRLADQHTAAELLARAGRGDAAVYRRRARELAGR